MAILKGDVKLVKSAVMDDVPEGGGAPTANLVVDGASNDIFPDISEMDRAAGRVSARKVHVWVQSDDTDTYLGGNVIVAEPPNDPNVSVTLMSTGGTFDRRDEVMPRVEAYLFVGTNYPGYLFGNHIEGQAAISILQREGTETPPIGGTLALTRYTGLSTEEVQYVRITGVSVVVRTFSDEAGDFKREEMTLNISDPLRADFPGFDALRRDPTIAQMDARTKISNVRVADAARYYGVVPTTEAAAVGDFSIKGESVFTQLVPSAQIETPIGDARTNQVSAAVVSGGGTVTATMTLAFSPSQSLYIGGAITPGTLSITGDGVTLEDNGGKLMSAGSQVGTIDYENGVASLLTSIFGGLTSFTVSYSPAAVPTVVNQSQGFKVTMEGRALSYARTLAPIPVRGSLSISYMVGRRWYVLRDDGSGAIRGGESAYGAGTVNFTTGTVLLTLGALPDVGSQVIFQWSDSDVTVDGAPMEPENDGRVFWPINSDGEVTTSGGSKAFVPGTVDISYAGFSASDDNGVMKTTLGDNVGTVDYAAGVVYLSPTALPAKGTNVTLSTDAVTRTAATTRPVSGGAGNLGATGIKPGSVYMTADVQLRMTATEISLDPSYGTVGGLGSTIDWGSPRQVEIVDDGAGGLVITSVGGQRLWTNQPCGTVNYTTGAFTLASVTFSADNRIAATKFDGAKVRTSGYENFMFL